MVTNWHSKEPSEIFDCLQTSESGISVEEAEKRLKEKGPNKLPDFKSESFGAIFLRQFKSPLIYVLLFAAIIVYFLGDFFDAGFIFFVLLFNAIIGAIQESKAQNTLLALKNFSETETTVLRNEKEFMISGAEVVAGDIILFQQGDKIPADARIIEAKNLQINEASLTGESLPINKTQEKIKKEKVQISDQKNMVFKGTYVVAGNGKAVVTATGLDTELGKISKQLILIDTEIPLKRDIRKLSRIIILVVFIGGIILFLRGYFNGNSAVEMLAVVVSLAVSIIPSGLPIVMTIILAAGVWRMAKHKAIVKNLQAVEALGQADILAVDKTGTITKNEMMVSKVYVNGREYEIKGSGFEPKGEAQFEGQNIDPISHPDLIFAAKIAAFASDAHVIYEEKEKEWKILGDPTEAALVVFTEKLGCHKVDIEREFPEIKDMPFDSDLKYHAVIRKVSKDNFLSVVGAPEVVLDFCSKIWTNERSVKMSDKTKKELENVFHKLSQQGLRILGFAFNKNFSSIDDKDFKGKLVFGGFFCIQDTVREEVAKALEESRLAGIKVIMITGDHKTTARAIAEKVGIYKEGDEIITGDEIVNLSEKELLQKVPKTSVFARVSPGDKLKIIELLKKTGKIVSMTGDGVNDAPSLVAADLGVAMGKIGTEVAKEAADIVLLDDNFGTIVVAVEEGRNMYKTIKKVILYLFSTSLGEFLTISTAVFMQLPLPLLPTQIIWLNLVTDGFLTVAIAMEPKNKNLISGKTNNVGRNLLDYLMAQRIILMALFMTIGTILVFQNYLGDMAKAWTMSLTVLAVFQWFNAWNCRSESESIFSKNFFANKALIVATFLIVGLQMLAVYHPFMQKILRTTALSLNDWLIAICVALSIIVMEELRKFAYRAFKLRQATEQTAIQSSDL